MISHFDSRNIPYIKDSFAIKGGNIPEFEREIGRAKKVVVFLSDKNFISPHTMYEWVFIHQNRKVKTIRYVYYTDEKIIAKDSENTVLFDGTSKPIQDCFNDYLEKCLIPSWKQWYDNLKKDIEESGRLLSEVEVYACNGDPSKKTKFYDYEDAFFQKTLLEIPSILKDASVLRDSYDKKLGSKAAFDIATWFDKEFGFHRNINYNNSETTKEFISQIKNNNFNTIENISSNNNNNKVNNNKLLLSNNSLKNDFLLKNNDNIEKNTDTKTLNNIFYRSNSNTIQKKGRKLKLGLYSSELTLDINNNNNFNSIEANRNYNNTI